MCCDGGPLGPSHIACTLRLQTYAVVTRPIGFKARKLAAEVCYYFSLGLPVLYSLSIYGATDEQLLQCLMLDPRRVLDIAVLTLLQQISTWAYYPGAMDAGALYSKLQHIRYTGVYEFEFSHLSAWWRHDGDVQRFERKRHRSSESA